MAAFDAAQRFTASAHALKRRPIQFRGVPQTGGRDLCFFVGVHGHRVSERWLIFNVSHDTFMMGRAMINGPCSQISPVNAPSVACAGRPSRAGAPGISRNGHSTVTLTMQDRPWFPFFHSIQFQALGLARGVVCNVFYRCAQNQRSARVFFTQDFGGSLGGSGRGVAGVGHWLPVAVQRVGGNGPDGG